MNLGSYSTRNNNKSYWNIISEIKNKQNIKICLPMNDLYNDRFIDISGNDRPCFAESGAGFPTVSDIATPLKSYAPFFDAINDQLSLSGTIWNGVWNNDFGAVLVWYNFSFEELMTGSYRGLWEIAAPGQNRFTSFITSFSFGCDIVSTGTFQGGSISYNTTDYPSGWFPVLYSWDRINRTEFSIYSYFNNKFRQNTIFYSNAPVGSYNSFRISGYTPLQALFRGNMAYFTVWSNVYFSTLDAKRLFNYAAY